MTESEFAGLLEEAAGGSKQGRQGARRVPWRGRCLTRGRWRTRKALRDNLHIPDGLAADNVYVRFNEGEALL